MAQPENSRHTLPDLSDLSEIPGNKTEIGLLQNGGGKFGGGTGTVTGAQIDHCFTVRKIESDRDHLFAGFDLFFIFHPHPVE